MQLPLDVRVLQVAEGEPSEVYLTLPWESGLPVSQQAPAAFATIAEVLRARGLRIMQERVFAPPADRPAVQAARAAALGSLADEIEPCWLHSNPAGMSVGGFGGIQVHALSGLGEPRILRCCNGRIARARMFEHGAMRWITASGLQAPAAGDEVAQARAVFVKALDLLAQARMDFRCVARTWIFMDDILAWYDELNQARNAFFIEQGLLVRGSQQSDVPASTGIGVSPFCGARCAVDFLAVAGAEGCVRRHAAAGKQRSAYEYGSAFARAATAITPAGKTLYVSGTAAIDETGATCFVGDAEGQVQMTLENTAAVIAGQGVPLSSAVQAIAYCKDLRVAEIFTGCWQGEFPWPWLVIIGDVCRDDLLFEVEVTAAAGVRKE